MTKEERMSITENTYELHKEEKEHIIKSIVKIIKRNSSSIEILLKATLKKSI